MPLEVADLAKSPLSIENMAFSKIRVGGLSDEEGLEFFNGLYLAAVLAKNDGDWSRVESFLDKWETDLISRARPTALRFDSAPWVHFDSRC